MTCTAIGHGLALANYSAVRKIGIPPAGLHTNNDGAHPDGTTAGASVDDLETTGYRSSAIARPSCLDSIFLMRGSHFGAVSSPLNCDGFDSPPQMLLGSGQWSHAKLARVGVVAACV